jgi:hypothetical protein
VDALGFIAEPDDDWPGAHRVTPVINGTSLATMIRGFEAQQGFDVPGG